MTEQVWYVALHTLPGWVVLPVNDEIDAAEWALANVREAALPDAPEERIEAAAHSLKLALDAMREGPVGGPYVAVAFQPDPLAEVLAWASAAAWPWGADGPIGLDEAATLIGSSGQTIGSPEHGRVELPGGPAVWTRRMYEMDAGDGPFVMEGLAYVVLPPKMEGFVMLTSQWAALPLGEEIAARIHELAVRLITEPPDGLAAEL